MDKKQVLELLEDIVRGARAGTSHDESALNLLLDVIEREKFEERMDQENKKSS